MHGVVGKVIRLSLYLTLGATLAACGGGASRAAPPATYAVGGTVTGLTGSGLVLTSDFGGDLALSVSGAFVFSTRLSSGNIFNVGVKTNPTSPLQLCQIQHGSGTVTAANVSMTVTCGNAYTVGGTVLGLVGSGLVLSTCVDPSGGGYNFATINLCGNNLAVSRNGTFTFSAIFPEMYSGRSVEITQQPSSPMQRCVVYSSEIRIQAANDTSVVVDCSVFAYVPNSADNTLSAYTVDAATGALTVVGTPIATGTSPYAIVGARGDAQDTRYVFVGNEGSNDISAFSANTTTGALAAVSGSPFAAGTDPKAMALYGSTALYAVNAGSNDVSAYSIDANTGALTPQSPATYATGSGPSSITIGAGSRIGGPFIFVANHGGSNDISVFSIDPITGVPTQVAGSPFSAHGNPLSLALGAGGQFLYAANPDATNPTISGFTVDPATGALTPLSGSPFPLPVSQYIASDLTGAYLYVTSGTNVVGYAIDAATGALSALPGFPIGAGADAYSVTIDPTNQFLYVALDGVASVMGFRLDATTGGLSLLGSAPFPAGNNPHFIATQ